MIIDWVAAGFDEAAFWRQTPRTLDLCFRGAAQRALRERQNTFSAVWHIEALARSGKKFPKHDAFVQPEKKAAREPMNPALIAARLRAHTVVNGGKIIKRSQTTKE